jgi:hypothetical protein
MNRVAGHQFEGVGTDQRCRLDDCGRWWTEIMDCTDADVGKDGIAHSGNLSAYELSQIKEKKQQEMRFWDAIEASAGRSYYRTPSFREE